MRPWTVKTWEREKECGVSLLRRALSKAIPSTRTDHFEGGGDGVLRMAGTGSLLWTRNVVCHAVQLGN